jgi:nitroreductase
MTTIHRPPASTLSALDVIFMRRSVRAYTPERIDEATIRGLLDAAVQAPTAMHEEPWAFVVIQDAARLARYSDAAKGHWAAEADRYQQLHRGADAAAATAFARRFASPDFSVFYNAGTLILICAKHTGPFAAADCWLSAENLMLAACAMGLGTCCIGSAIPALNTPPIKSELGIPSDVDVVVPIIVGVPSAAAVDSPRRAPDILSWKR